MEVKTCEQYVLQKLEIAENDVESLKMDIICKDSQIESLTDELNETKSFVNEIKSFIRRRFTIYESLNNNSLNFDEPWERHDEHDYKLIANILKEGQEGK